MQNSKALSQRWIVSRAIPSAAAGSCSIPISIAVLPTAAWGDPFTATTVCRAFIPLSSFAFLPRSIRS